MKAKRIVSAVTAAAMLMPVLASAAYAEDNTELMAAKEPYVCDFSALVKDNTKTEYGTADDVIQLDDYTTAYLTYEGTYVDEDASIHTNINGTGNKNGNYKLGSYLAFTAPSDGVVTASGENLSIYEGNTYKTYGGTVKLDTKEGQTYYIGARKSPSTIKTLTFTPAEEPAPDVTGFDEITLNGINARVNVPSQTDGIPLAVYLSGEDGRGTDNMQQVVNARPFMSATENKAVLIAPQTETAWDTDSLKGFIDEAKAEYKTSTVIIVGQKEDAAEAYKLFDAADKIITIDGLTELGENDITAIAQSGKPIMAFGAYEGLKRSEVRTPVTALQTAGANIQYTEFPYGTNTAEQAAAQESTAQWILNENENSKVVDLVLFSGQSNMAGRGDYADSIVCPPGQGYEYHSVTEPKLLSSVSEPFGKYENNSVMNDAGSNGIDRRSGDMVAALMKSYYENGGVPIVGVQASRGGQETKYFKQSSIMTEMTSRYNEAEEYLKSAGYTVRRKFLVWCQGEADADNNRSDDTYKGNTLSIFNSIKAVTGITDSFIVQTGHYNINKDSSDAGFEKDNRYKRICKDQKALADENDDIYTVASLYTDEALANMRDAYHYYQPTYNSIGTIAGQNIAAAYDSSIESIPVPQPSDEPEETAAPSNEPEETTAPTDKPNETDKPSDDKVTEKIFDYNDSTKAAPIFKSVGPNGATCEYTDKEDAADKYIKVNAAKAGTGKITASYLDLSEYTKDASKITLSFDMHVPYNSRSMIALTDTDVRGDNFGGSNGSSYNSKGDIATIFGGNKSLKVNGTDIAGKIAVTDSNGNTDAAWVHYNYEIDFVNKTVSYSAKSLDGNTIYTSGADKAFTDTDVKQLSGIEVYSWLAGEQLSLDNLYIKAEIPAFGISIEGENSIARIKDASQELEYKVNKTYIDDSESIKWSVSGVDGVSIDENTGKLTISGSAGTGTAVIKAVSSADTSRSAEYSVKIEDYAIVKSYDVTGSLTLGVGGTTEIGIENVIDTLCHDITKYVRINDVKSSDSTIISAEGNKLTAVKPGTANLTFTIYTGSSDAANTVTVAVKSGVYEITSSDKTIDISALVTYGADSCRLYKADGSYKAVDIVNNTVENPDGGSVTVVPIYKFSYRSTAENGYTAATGEYNSNTGYGLESGINYNGNENGVLPVEGRPLKVDLPEGYYDINITRIGGCRSDVYSNGNQIVNNTTSSGSQNRPSGTGVMEAPRMLIEGGNLNMTIGNVSGSNERIAYVEIVGVPNNSLKSTVWVAGDSESANYYPIDSEGSDLDSRKIMMTGFGMQLRYFLSDKYNIANFGQPSATVKTWYDECFASVIRQIRQGDTIIIDFGINDAVSTSNKISVDVMKEYMKNICDAVKAKGAVPILVSPVYCGKYQGKSYFTYNTSSGTNAEEEFAKEIGVQFIDLNKWLTIYTNNAIEATGDENWRTNNYHVGDNLHMTQHGALLAASIIAAGMNSMGYETTDYSYTYKDIKNIGEGYVRGEENAVSRNYSVNDAKQLMGISVSTPTPTPIPDGIVMKYDEKSGKVSVTSSDSTITSGTLAKAVYDGERLVSVSIQDINFSDGAVIAPQDGMKLMLWNSAKEMKPLTDAYTYKAVTETAAPTASPSAKPTQQPTATPGSLSTPSPTPTSEPEGKVLYTQNFESYNTGDKADWTTTAGFHEIREDNTDAQIGKYLIKGSEKGKEGTCRSAYFELPQSVTGNFVFECDYKSSSNSNVADLELLQDKSAVYANHGVYSNKNYVFTMAKPRGTNCYVINNKFDDSGASLASYTAPVFTTADITSNPWIHVKVIGDMKNQVIYVTLTSLDGKTEYHHGKYDMNVGRDTAINSWKCIHILGHTNAGDTAIDNIKVSEATDSNLAQNYHDVTITCKGESFKQYVKDGDSVVNIPDVSNFGDSFEGWTVGSDTTMYTSEQLKNVKINSDCEIVGHINANYIEPMASVEFKNFPTGNELVMGTDENTFGSNPISLSILGEQGTSLVTNPDERVKDYNVEWTFDGFRTLDGSPTGETGNKYCDSYAVLETTDTAHNTSVDFTLKKTAANYYGRVTAKVTYNGKTMEVTSPLVLLGEKSGNNILPKSGYASDYNKYEDTMTGYSASGNDVVLGGWDKSGSDSSSLTLNSENGGKYVSFIRKGSGNSAYLHQNIGNISGEIVIEQDIRFGMNASFEYGADTSKGTTTAFNSTAFSFRLDNGKFKLNGTEIGSGEHNKWYHIVLSADTTSKKCTAKVYDYSADGNYTSPIAQSSLADFDSSFTKGAYFRYTLNDKTANKGIDINNLTIKTAETDESTFTITAPLSVNIPLSETEKAELSAEAKTIFGTDSIGLAQWSIEDEFAEGVSIASTGDRSAELTVSSNASSGIIPVRCTIGGKSKIVEIKLIGTKDNAAFTNAPLGVMLGSTAQYSAVVRNGQGDEIEGRTVSYELYNADNTEKISPSGISLDEATGRLTVSDSAEPQVIGIRAVSGDLTKFVRVNVYGLKFAFGTDSISNGYTPVNSGLAYNASRGYGIEGTPESRADSNTLSNLTFKVKLEKGKVYEVTAKYKGTIICEKASSSLSGFERSLSALASDTFKTAVFGDDVMDITIPSGSEIVSVEIKPVEKSAAEKPDWWTIGDSTVQQNGSWGYTIASDKTTDLSKYPELAKVVNGFHNSGKAGDSHRSYYTSGRFNNVLTGINSGDIVSLSGMGTNDSSSTQEQFKEYDKIYIDAVIDMGGYVILGSYTPTGNYGATKDKVYDADTMTFNGMRTNPYDRAIRELYEEYKDNPQVLGFIDIGKAADEQMTADVKAAYNAAIASGADETSARAAANAKAEEMMAWWKDYNHYYTSFSNYILPWITSSVAALAGNIGK